MLLALRVQRSIDVAWGYGYKDVISALGSGSRQAHTGWPVVVTGSEGAMGMGGGGAARQGGATSWCKSEPRGKVDQRPMVPVVWESLPLGMQHERACHQVVDLVTGEMIAGAVREVLL